MADGPGENTAIVAHYRATFTLANVAATATGGTKNVALHNTMSQVTVDGSVLSAATTLEHDWNGGSQARSLVANTRLDGALPANTGGVIKCVGTYDGSFSPVACP